MRTIVGPLLAGLLVCGPAFAQEPGPSIDPLLRGLLEPETRALLEATRELGPGTDLRSQPFAGMLDLDRNGPGGAVRVGALVRVEEERALDRLRQAGAAIGSRVGDIAVVRLPLDALDAASGLSGIRTIQASRPIELHHNRSRVWVNVNDVRDRIGSIWTGTAGQDVLVGVFDTGLDYRHPDFQDGDGDTRLLGLWDQVTSGTPPQSYGYGNYCSVERLNEGGCSQRDTNGHGTHVAGTAAGDGSATGEGGTPYTYAGMAPAADILVVNGGNSGFGTDEIVDGVAWMFAEADRLGKPIVVNLSLGGDYGPHDGTRLFEQAVTALTGPGKLLVVSAGNSGSNPTVSPPSTPFLIHAMALPQVGVAEEFVINVPAYTGDPGTCNDLMVLDLWYEAGDSLTIEVFRPDASSFGVGYGQDRSQDDPGGQIRIAHAPDGADPENGDNEVEILVSDCGTSGEPDAGEWRVRVTPTVAASGGHYHLWLWLSSFGSSAGASGATGFDNAYVVGSPGTADGAITVGAFATKMEWTSPLGTFSYSQQETIGDLARFSSGGPRRDGVLKPEITAPGIGIVSAASSTASIPRERLVTDEVHWILEGTSMSAPHVTGILALLLQHDPTLAPADVRDILSRTSLQDNFTTRTYGTAPGTDATSWWGYGKIDARAALSDITDLSQIASVLVIPRSDTIGTGDTLALQGYALTGDGQQSATSLSWTSSDPSVAIVDADGLVTALTAGSTVITASTGSLSDSTVLQVVDPATLIVTAEGIAPPETFASSQGTILPLVEIGLKVDGAEDIRVSQLGFDVAGRDPGARLLLVEDADGNGLVGSSEPVVADTSVELVLGDTVLVRVQLESFVVPEQDSLTVLAALRMSGSAPHGATFQMTFRPEDTRSVGELSGTENLRDDPTDPVASPVASTTVLQTGEVFAMSENPVTSGAGRVIFNFDPNEPPNTAAIYTLDGRRVVDLMPLVDTEGGNRAVWLLRNDDGGAVAPGIYILVVRFDDRLIREKLIIARSAGGS